MSAGMAAPATSRNVGAKSMFRATASLVVPRLDGRRPADEERHAQRLLVHEALVEHAVVAEKEALIARVDDDGVLRESAGVQEGEHAADVVVHGLNRGEVVLHVALILPSRQRFAA